MSVTVPPRRNRFALLAACAVALIDTANVVAAAVPMQRREADLDEASIVKFKGSDAPAGPLLLIFGGLGVSAVALIFVVIKMLLPGHVSTSGRRIMEERAKAKTDLRVRGAASRRNSPAGLSPSGPVSPSSTPDTARVLMSDRDPFAPKDRYGVKAEHAKSWSRPSVATQGTMSSLADVPMLTAHGRANTTFSSESYSSGEGKKSGSTIAATTASTPVQDIAFTISPSGTRRPALPARSSTYRSSTVYRGTDLNLSRQPSNPTRGRVTPAPAWVDASQSRDPGTTTGRTGRMSALVRHASDSPDHSRRNSASNLLGDERLSRSSSSDAMHSAFSQASSTNPPSHPLSPQRSIPAINSMDYSGKTQHSSRPAVPQGHRPRNARPAVFVEEPYSDVPRARPQQTTTRYRDVERDTDLSYARPGQYRQPVAPGNGRRGSRGGIAGSRRSR